MSHIYVKAVRENKPPLKTLCTNETITSSCLHNVFELFLEKLRKETLYCGQLQALHSSAYDGMDIVRLYLSDKDLLACR